MGKARLSGFVDEINTESLEAQVAGARELGIGNVALRTCFGKNVMDWTADECGRIKSALDAAGLGVSEIGSPVGKVPIDSPFEQTQAALAHAVELARLFETPNIRMFSFYPPEAGGSVLDHRDEVLRRLCEMCRQIEGEPVTMVLENEAELYGDMPEQCLDIFQNVQSPKMRMAFDFANFVSRRFVEVYEQGWKPLKPYVTHIHVKDHKPGEKTACPAGEGDGNVKPVLAELAAAGYDGFLTLEPHLSKAGRFSGFTGIEKFRLATEALRKLCAEVGLKIE